MSPLAPPRQLTLALAGLALSASTLAPFSRAQSNYATPYFFTTLAGSGMAAFADGTGTAASLRFPNDVAVDTAGNLFVADSNNFRVRKITPSGVVTTLTGPGGTTLPFGQIRGIAVDGGGNIYIGGFSSHTIQKLTPAGVLTTLAGQNNVSGTINGTGSEARFNLPIGIAVDSGGNLYVADSGNHAIRKVTPTGVVTTFAGLAGTSGSANGTGDAARFSSPRNIALDGAGNLYVADSGNDTVRKISPDKVVTTLAGTAGTQGSLDATGSAARFSNPTGMAVDTNGNVYVGSFSATIRKITPGGVVTTLAGVPGAPGDSDGLGSAARFFSPLGLAVDDIGNVYFADANNNKIRRSVFPPTVTPSPSPEPVVISVNVGATVGFNSEATSDYPMTFQWQKNGIVIPGATAQSLALNNVQPADAATYTFVATNLAGSSTSGGRMLVVRTPPTITTQPVSQTVTAGLPVLFSVVISSSTPASFQWRKNGVAITGATNNAFAIGSPALSDAGTYSVAVSNSAGTATSNNATLTVTVPVSTAPVTHTVTVGSLVQFNYTATPAPGTTFQWRKDGTPIPGATSPGLTINSATLADAGNYTVVTTTGTVSQLSNTATLIVLPVTPPTITTQPVSRTVTVGVTVQFSVAVSSSVAPTFQWRKNGVALAGATSDLLTIPSASLNDTGSYSVVVTNSGGTTTSNNATLTVNAPVGTAPTITTHPADQTVNAGATILLSATVSGTQPFSFQWFKDGMAIPGASTILFSISNAQAADAASYSIVVTNSAGVATSNAAVVRVIVPPSIATQPASQSAVVGGSAGFVVAANGSPPFTYQWLKDGSPLTGATTGTLALNPLRPADAGSYTVIVTNGAGTVTSAPAILTLSPGSRLANVSIRTTLTAGQTVIIGLAVEGGSRNVLVRAIGPSLAAFSVPGAMADPRLELYQGSSLVVANDDWPANLAPTFVSSGAFGLALGSRDAALHQSLSGAFSLQARGTGAGVVLVEAYDLGEASVARVVNVSARNRVGTGEDILIAGFTVAGTGTKQVLIRAVGPGLAAFGVPGTLVDPQLDVFNSSGTRVAENDNWASGLAPTFSAVGAFALTPGSRDAAILAPLPIGAYTVQVHGADNGTGEAIVEVYEVP